MRMRGRQRAAVPPAAEAALCVAGDATCLEADVARRRRWPSPWHLFLVPMSLLMAFPFLWMVITSVSTVEETRTYPPGLPASIQWQNFVDAWTTAPFSRWLLNTTIVALASVAGNLVFCSLAGYALARMRFIGSSVAFILILATLMVPFQVVMIPTLLIVRAFGLVDTLGALIVPNLVTPFGIFLLLQFFRTLPIEIEEAARIDGAGRLGTLVKIVLPQMKAPLATVAIMTLLWRWNEFLWPLIVITSEDKMTLPLGLSTFQGAHSINMALLMAGTLMSQLPMLLVFVVAQRWFVQSLASSGIKG
jgi:multiple sugar transport system permease protein